MNINGIRFRASLYFMIAFLVPFTDQVVEFLKADKWPSGPRFLLAILLGIGGGLVALRAYYDGSAQRHEDEQKDLIDEPKTP